MKPMIKTQSHLPVTGQHPGHGTIGFEVDVFKWVGDSLEKE